ncbi:hypothetical protein TRIUR3_34832 [Triticum urartu]|uniref:Uncharacterized protein n=1 Tax=Triticum urartu TaxID=4572 RepID=M7YHA5_TRIUA|nr:hypothetical protein TRIUR3_34832 [Triticum urartu]
MANDPPILALPEDRAASHPKRSVALSILVAGASPELLMGLSDVALHSKHPGGPSSIGGGRSRWGQRQLRHGLAFPPSREQTTGSRRRSERRENG